MKPRLNPKTPAIRLVAFGKRCKTACGVFRQSIHSMFPAVNSSFRFLLSSTLAIALRTSIMVFLMTHVLFSSTQSSHFFGKR